ncbi:hypothetical protein U0Y97_10330 [Enterobacter chuandaensis]|uniref:hypothetical protein n=1 Tax=Enterobacter chuandaensis TaxID=2497875 RepID=UPI0039C29955
MLDAYYGLGSTDNSNREQKQRLLAVQAALEIAKAAAPSGSVSSALDEVTDSIKKAADAIQEALDN